MVGSYTIGFFKNLYSDIVVVEAELNITSGLTWDDSLLIKTSILYRNQTAQIVAKVISPEYTNKFHESMLTAL
jgi:isocitrate dehydrogenase kinase/phosphatase